MLLSNIILLFCYLYNQRSILDPNKLSIESIEPFLCLFEHTDLGYYKR